jgi:hypothetical protein
VAAAALFAACLPSGAVDSPAFFISEIALEVAAFFFGFVLGFSSCVLVLRTTPLDSLLAPLNRFLGLEGVQ